MRKILVLIIDDDPACSELLKTAMLDVGYMTHAVKTLAEGYKELETARPDLIVLDRGLPDGDGVQFCLTLRKDSRYRTIPILMLTGKGEVEDRVLGLRFGADDYLAKPFDMEELMARADGLVRRCSPELADCGDRLECGALAVDLKARQAQAGGENVQLSLMEYELLRVLLERANIPVTREFLLEAVWKTSFNSTSHKVVDVTVMNLRKKLGAFGEMITSVRGLGYKLSAPGH